MNLKSRYIIAIASLFFVSCLTTCKDKNVVTFGKDWKNGPDEELLEGNIYYVRNNKDTNSEYLFDLYNADPREVAKREVVKFAKELLVFFETKNYAKFVWKVGDQIFEPLGEKYNIKKNAIGEAWIKSFKTENTYCSADLFFKDPIKKIEIRAYEALEPSKRENGNTDYSFVYRIDFLHNLETKGNAITINLHTNFVKRPTILITRIIDHCPIPELMDEPDPWH